jgi:hypothetical protein
MYNDHPAFRGSSNGSSRQRQQQQQQRSSNSRGSGHGDPHSMMQAFFGFPSAFNDGFGMSSGGGGGAFTSFSSFSSGSGSDGPKAGVVKSTSRSTKMINGKKFVTTK